MSEDSRLRHSLCEIFDAEPKRKKGRRHRNREPRAGARPYGPDEDQDAHGLAGKRGQRTTSGWTLSRILIHKLESRSMDGQVRRGGREAGSGSLVGSLTCVTVASAPSIAYLAKDWGGGIED